MDPKHQKCEKPEKENWRKTQRQKLLPLLKKIEIQPAMNKQWMHPSEYLAPVTDPRPPKVFLTATSAF